MKRSGDVTASAIVLFCGSAFWIVVVSLAINAALTAESYGLPGDARVGWLFLWFTPAVWGIITATGVLMLRRWAWISIIVMSGVAIFFSSVFAVALWFMPSLLKDRPDLSAANVRMVVDIGLAILLMAMAIAVWWLVLFTRTRVRIQFAKYGAGSGASATPEIASLPSVSRSLTSVPPASEMPTSIRAIAIVSIVGAAFLLLSLQFIVRTHRPMLIFGMFASGWPVFAYGAALVTAQTVLPIYTLRKRAWALEGMIWYAFVTLANAFLFLTSPARNRYFDVLNQGDIVPPGVNAEVMDHLRRTTIYAGVVFGICVGVVCLYFLFTRRKAYRPACEARQTAA